MKIRYYLIFCFLISLGESSFLELATVQPKSNNYSNPAFYNSQREVIVYLLEWRWQDIALECEQYLAPIGFGGVQVSPPHENHVITSTQTDPRVKRPWYERYEPVSYLLESNSGTRAEFQDMVNRCNNVGVRVYVEVVLNHMANDSDNNVGVAGSTYDAINQLYPAVPYDASHFKSPLKKCYSKSGNIEDFQNLEEIRNCKYRGLNDLDQANHYVATQIVNYLNELISIGVGGFYVGDATMMHPSDLKSIYSSINNLNTKYFLPNTRPFIYNGVVDADGNVVSSADYTDLGRVTEIKYIVIFSDTFQGRDTFASIGTKLASGMLYSDQAVVQIDGPITRMFHDFEVQLNKLNSSQTLLYQMASATMLAIPYGIKVVLSSYDTENEWSGVPRDSNGRVLPVVFNRDGSCRNNYTCQHRWPAIAHMVRFCITAARQPITDIEINSAGNQMSFTRGDVAFFAISKDPSLTMVETVSTSLPPGRYCDILTGSMVRTTCTGRIVIVDRSGKVGINLRGGEDNMLAIHVGAMIESFEGKLTTTPSSTTTQSTKSPLISSTSRKPLGGNPDLFNLNTDTTQSDSTPSTSTTNTGNNPTITTNSTLTFPNDLQTPTTIVSMNSTLTMAQTEELATGDSTTDSSSTIQATEPTTDASTSATSTTVTDTETSTTIAPLSSAVTAMDITSTDQPPITLTPTIVLIHKETFVGQNLFILGGRRNCGNGATDCWIPIKHKYYNNDTISTSYGQWSINDTYLDWNGAETTQGKYDSTTALGTPLLWTTNDASASTYVSYNNYGPHYWMGHLLMNCSVSEYGWFYFYASFLDMTTNSDPTNDIDIVQVETCQGTTQKTPATDSGYHVGLCGKINVYEYGSGTCRIDDFTAP